MRSILRCVGGIVALAIAVRADYVSLMSQTVSVTSSCPVPATSIRELSGSITTTDDWSTAVVTLSDAAPSLLLTLERAVLTDVIVSLPPVNGPKPRVRIAAVKPGDLDATLVFSIAILLSCNNATCGSLLAPLSLPLGNFSTASINAGLDYVETVMSKYAASTPCGVARNRNILVSSYSTPFASVTRSMAVYDRADGASPDWDNLRVTQTVIREAICNDIAVFAQANGLSTFTSAQLHFDTAENFQIPSPAFLFGVPLRVIVALTIFAVDASDLQKVQSVIVDRRMQVGTASAAMQRLLGTPAVTPIDVRVLTDENEQRRNAILGLDSTASQEGKCDSQACRVLVGVWCVLIPILALEVVYGASGERSEAIEADARKAESMLAGTEDAQEAQLWKQHHRRTTERVDVARPPPQPSPQFAMVSQPGDEIDLEAPAQRPAGNDRQSKRISPAVAPSVAAAVASHRL